VIQHDWQLPDEIYGLVELSDGPWHLCDKHAAGAIGPIAPEADTDIEDPD
jgi:hypothetical protein